MAIEMLRPEDCEHNDVQYLGNGYCSCNDCGILMSDEIPVSQLKKWGVKYLDDPEAEEDNASSE